MNTPFVTELLTHIEQSFGSSSAAESGKELAEVLRILASIEIAPGGPYACKPGGTQDDVDIGLNLIIALFLRSHGVSLPALNAFIERRLAEKTPTSLVAGKRSLAELVQLYATPPASSLPRPVSKRTREEETMLLLVRDAAHARLASCSPELRTAALRVIDRTIEGNPDKQMSLMAWYLREALGSKGEHIHARHIAELGVANIYFWTAFIIYDDFWDEDEAAEPRLLPVANLFARHYTDFFSNACAAETGFREFFHRTMDALDEANVWEMSVCRMSREKSVVHIPEVLPAYGDYSIKFHPAAGHILGPVLMLIELGYAIDSPEVAGFIAYAKHYLIAMQLNDDMHDWKEDLARGHISTTVAALLAAVMEKDATKRSIDLVEDMEMLEHVFWFEVLPSLCASVLDHTDAAREELNALHFLEDPMPLEQFIIRNERIAHEALSEQEQTSSFLSQMDK